MRVPEVDVLDLARCFTLHLRVRRLHEWRWRLQLASWLIGAAAWLIGCGIDVNEADQ